jgi:hypothetical protein
MLFAPKAFTGALLRWISFPPPSIQAGEGKSRAKGSQHTTTCARLKRLPADICVLYKLNLLVFTFHELRFLQRTFTNQLFVCYVVGLSTYI